MQSIGIMTKQRSFTPKKHIKQLLVEEKFPFAISTQKSYANNRLHGMDQA